VRAGFRELAGTTERLEDALGLQGTHVDRLNSAFRLRISIEQNAIALKQNATSIAQNNIAIKQNEVMKWTAILAATISPQVLVVGFYGMNFTGIPYDKLWLLGVSMGAGFIASAGMIVFGYAKGWLRSEVVPEREPRDQSKRTK
jgi:Mg2+ and Co2+ transporter CorA